MAVEEKGRGYKKRRDENKKKNEMVSMIID
jgi:hypothetical protein